MLISPVLASLHWLPVKSRIDLKVLLLIYKALNDLAPNYLKELDVPYCPPRSLRSQSAGLLLILRIGGREGSEARATEPPSSGTISLPPSEMQTPFLYSNRD